MLNETIECKKKGTVCDNNVVKGSGIRVRGVEKSQALLLQICQSWQAESDLEDEEDGLGTRISRWDHRRCEHGKVMMLLSVMIAAMYVLEHFQHGMCTSIA